MAAKAPTTRRRKTGSASAAQRSAAALRPHPQAKLVPPLTAAEYGSFRDDVRARGLLEPLAVTRQGVVLDGHLRLRVAVELGIKAVPVRVVSPADELEFMLLSALQRRHLSQSQKAALVLELDRYRKQKSEASARRRANLNGQRAEVATLPHRGKTRDLAAEWAGVSARTIQDAATVAAADQELFEQVKRGALPAERAARQVRQQRRDAALPVAPPLPDGVFDLIYADPPWRLAGSPDSSRAVEKHYPTMPLEEILALAIPAADNAGLFLWAVNSMLPEALAVITAWGFTYVTNFSWVKNKWGLGHYNRTQHELLLVGKRGSFPPPETSRRASSVIHAPRRAHSQKPEQVYGLLEYMYPDRRKLELFARGKPRAGWSAWGNEVKTEAKKRAR